MATEYTNLQGSNCKKTMCGCVGPESKRCLATVEMFGGSYRYLSVHSFLHGGLFSEKQSQNLNPSYKTDLDIWHCFRRENPKLIKESHKTDLDIWSNSPKEKSHFIAE